ncbi:MAG: hypothetical protein ACKER6_00235, partial [Candidatus Hodgkinia cicadicola]
MQKGDPNPLPTLLMGPQNHPTSHTLVWRRGPSAYSRPLPTHMLFVRRLSNMAAESGGSDAERKQMS